MNDSPAMRRYAAEIYRLQQDTPQVPISLLSEHIQASVQAISQMVRRLKECGFLVHGAYRGVRLTESGERIAMPALRRHRLTEVFLVRIMGYDWAAAHELADTFEQGVNDELEDRMDSVDRPSNPLSARRTHPIQGRPHAPRGRRTTGRGPFWLGLHHQPGAHP